MELKEQIEQLEKDFNNRIQELKNQINKPNIEVGKEIKLEVGDWFEADYGDGIIKGKITKVTDDLYYYFGYYYGNFWTKEDYIYIKSSMRESLTKLSEQEITQLLTRYCDELFKDCDRVDRSGMLPCIAYSNDIVKIDKTLTDFTEYGFRYNGKYVMDKHGNFAKGLKRDPKEMYANIYDNSVERYLGSEVYNSLQKAKDESTPVNVKCIGTFKLVPVD